MTPESSIAETPAPAASRQSHPASPQSLPEGTVPAPRFPRGGLLILAAAGFTAVTTELLPSGLLPQISRDLGVEESAVGSLTAAYAAVIVFTALPLSRLLAGRVPRKTLLIATVLAFAVSNVMLALSPVLGLAIAARLLGGVAHGMLWSSMAPYVARIVPAHSVGKAMAIVFSGNSIALAVGAPIGTLMGSVLTWRDSFLVLAGVGGLLALLAVWVLPAAPDGGGATAPSLRGALKLPGVIAVATAWPLLLLGHFTLFTYIAPFLQSSGLPDAFTGISLSVVGVASLLGIWIAGLTADSRPRRSLLSAVAVLVGAFALLPVLGGTWAGELALVTLWGAAFGAIGIYNQAAILRAGGEHKDAANGLTVVTIQLGIAVGAGYGAVALGAVGARFVPLAAAIPTAAALAIILASRRGGYPAGPRETRKVRTSAIS
ncbi:MFS transporter [Arthrobacter sp. NicSoilB8]|uniref:MFS transporter n=1 Tax=Arthrobacter sp. NicSoilB8 TaxID=2830998 RepID=UPI001CC68B61|nr:MFS transporter [Arthrobacter sp. NicSoilB8]BCW69054.1 MFS transporter [Arthrobacter sp. NicSoilB8]